MVGLGRERFVSDESEAAQRWESGVCAAVIIVRDDEYCI